MFVRFDSSRLRPRYLETDEFQDALARYRRGDNEAVATIIASQLPWVISLANKLKREGWPIDVDDLVAEAILAISTALPRFAGDEPAHFHAFVGKIVFGAMRDAIGNDRIIYIPKYVIETIHKIEAADRFLRLWLGRTPTIRELSENSGVPQRQVKAWIKGHCREPIPLTDEWLTRFADPKPLPLEQIFVRDEFEAAATAMGQWTPEQREVTYMRIIEGLTYPEIAERLGCTSKHVHYVMTRVREKTRHLQETIQVTPTP